MARHLALLLAVVALVAAPTRAGFQAADSPAEDPARVARRDLARSLAESVVAGALDPRRDGAALVTAARAASLAWKLDPVLGRTLFGRTLERAEALLASDTARQSAVDALPFVLASLASRDPEAGLEAARHLAAAAAFAAAPGERARLMAAIASAIAGTNRDGASRFLSDSLAVSAAGDEAWQAIGAFDGDEAKPLVDRALETLEAGGASGESLVTLANAASFGHLLSVGSSIELNTNGSPEIASRWLALVARRLEFVRRELVAARAEGRPPRLDEGEVALAGRLELALLAAFDRWLPDARDLATAALYEVRRAGAPPPLVARDPNGARPAADAPKPTAREAEDAAINAAFDLARDRSRRNREAEARAALASVADLDARAAATDDVELIFAAEEYGRGDWPGVARRVGKLSSPSLRTWVLGALALGLAKRGAGDVALGFAGDALRSSAKAEKDLLTVSGLLDASLAYGRLGDAVAARGALAEALGALDRAELDPTKRDECRCRPFAPSTFDGKSVSAGLAMRLANLPLDAALAAEAERDIVAARAAVASLASVEAREIASIALLKALVA